MFLKSLVLTLFSWFKVRLKALSMEFLKLEQRHRSESWLLRYDQKRKFFCLLSTKLDMRFRWSLRAAISWKSWSGHFTAKKLSKRYLLSPPFLWDLEMDLIHYHQKAWYLTFSVIFFSGGQKVEKVGNFSRSKSLFFMHNWEKVTIFGLNNLNFFELLSIRKKCYVKTKTPNLFGTVH